MELQDTLDKLKVQRNMAVNSPSLRLRHHGSLHSFIKPLFKDYKGIRDKLNESSNILSTIIDTKSYKKEMEQEFALSMTKSRVEPKLFPPISPQNNQKSFKIYNKVPKYQKPKTKSRINTFRKLNKPPEGIVFKRVRCKSSKSKISLLKYKQSWNS